MESSEEKVEEKKGGGVEFCWGWNGRGRRMEKVGGCLTLLSSRLIDILKGFWVSRPRLLRIEEKTTLILAPKSARALSTLILPIIKGKEKLPVPFIFCGSMFFFIRRAEHSSPSMCVDASRSLSFFVIISFKYLACLGTYIRRSHKVVKFPIFCSITAVNLTCIVEMVSTLCTPAVFNFDHCPPQASRPITRINKLYLSVESLEDAKQSLKRVKTDRRLSPTIRSRVLPRENSLTLGPTVDVQELLLLSRPLIFVPKSRNPYSFLPEKSKANPVIVNLKDNAKRKLIV
ncbi:hypothetical protein M9H77_23351 [Catharanthus roseus]|uniref:Uncharacterized protein n=1 Tax=Catharanthus roseus TaxID=4058 RepID=A0ACC0AX57_CATRO|nr:hypothetical protein M9H77_23351 [Catharanthus roseus]